MFPGVNPKQMKQMMKKMGMQQEDLDASQVIITLADKKLIFNDAQVAKVKMMGQETYQITGEPVEEALSTIPEISEDDLQTVMDQTSCSQDEAMKAIMEHNGDLAAAIMSLSE